MFFMNEQWEVEFREMARKIEESTLLAESAGMSVQMKEITRLGGLVKTEEKVLQPMWNKGKCCCKLKTVISDFRSNSKDPNYFEFLLEMLVRGG